MKRRPFLTGSLSVTYGHLQFLIDL